jgi:hypothetical protein
MSYAVKIKGERLEERITAETQTDIMKKSVRIFINKFDLLKKIELPKRMRERAILNTVPQHPTGTEMTQYEKLADDCYLFLDLPSRSKKSQIKKLADICGAEVMFENW